jgi:RNA methyltransferase, TrmH family
LCMSRIESSQNETFKKILSLTSAKGLKAEGLFLLSGAKLVGELLRKPGLTVVHQVVGPRMDVMDMPSASVVELSAELFAQIDVLGTGYPVLVLQQPAVERVDRMAGYAAKGMEVVIPVGDPGNLGALLRSCEAFGVARAILTKEAAHPFLPKSVKASAGSVLRLPMAYGPALKEFPEDCIALDACGASVYDFAWPKRGLMVVGEEGAGIGSRFKTRVGIPTKGVESLNAVVAGSLALGEWARKNSL